MSQETAPTETQESPVQTPVVEVASAPAKPKDLSSEYDFGDTNIDLNFDAAPEELATKPSLLPAEGAVADTAPSVSSPRARDEKGQFLPVIKHPARLTRMAEDLGLDAELVARTATEQLDEMVYHLNKRAIDEARQATRLDLLHPDKGLQARDQNASEVEQPQQSQTDFGLDWGKDDTTGEPVTEQDIAPGIVNVLKSQAKRIAELEGKINGFFQKQANDTIGDKIDQFFAKTNAPSIYGSGSRHEMQADSGELARRMAVINEAKRLAGSKSTTAQQLAKLEQAHNNIYGHLVAAPKKPAAPVRDEVDELLSDRRNVWREGALSRPTQRRGSDEPNGEAKAMRNVAIKLKEAGLASEDDDTDAEGFL